MEKLKNIMIIDDNDTGIITSNNSICYNSYSVNCEVCGVLLKTDLNKNNVAIEVGYEELNNSFFLKDCLNTACSTNEISFSEYSSELNTFDKSTTNYESPIKQAYSCEKSYAPRSFYLSPLVANYVNSSSQHNQSQHVLTGWNAINETSAIFDILSSDSFFDHPLCEG